MKAHYLNEHCNEYNVTCNKVKVLKNGLTFTSLKVKVFPFFNTSLKVKVLTILLKYSNALLLLRYLQHCLLFTLMIADSVFTVQLSKIVAGLSRYVPRQQKFRAMNGAHLASQSGESLDMLIGPSWAPKFIALLGTKFGAH